MKYKHEISLTGTHAELNSDWIKFARPGAKEEEIAVSEYQELAETDDGHTFILSEL